MHTFNVGNMGPSAFRIPKKSNGQKSPSKDSGARTGDIHIPVDPLGTISNVANGIVHTIDSIAEPNKKMKLLSSLSVILQFAEESRQTEAYKNLKHPPASLGLGPTREEEVVVPEPTLESREDYYRERKKEFDDFYLSQQIEYLSVPREHKSMLYQKDYLEKERNYFELLQELKHKLFFGKIAILKNRKTFVESVFKSLPGVDKRMLVDMCMKNETVEIESIEQEISAKIQEKIKARDVALSAMPYAPRRGLVCPTVRGFDILNFRDIRALTEFLAQRNMSIPSVHELSWRFSILKSAQFPIVNKPDIDDYMLVVIVETWFVVRVKSLIPCDSRAICSIYTKDEPPFSSISLLYK